MKNTDIRQIQLLNQNLNQYSITSKILKNELDDVDDEVVNSAYNYFTAEKMRYYDKVYVKLNRNFRKRKITQPIEWDNFKAVIRICNNNKFHLKCYIKYCFMNKLVMHSKGRSLADIVYLRNLPQVIEYARNKNRIEKLYQIYISIQKAIFLIKKLKGENKSTREVLKEILNTGKILDYVYSGTISPYFMALIPNANIFIHKFIGKYADEKTVFIDFCNGLQHYKKQSIDALGMFFPDAMNKSIIDLCE